MTLRAMDPLFNSHIGHRNGFCSLILQAPACLITPYEDALSLGTDTFHLRRDMLCQGVNVWTKNLYDFRVLCLQDTTSFLNGHGLLIIGKRKLIEVEKWPVNRNTTSFLVNHLINTSLGAEEIPKAVSIKNAPLGHPPLALAALSISNVALVRTPVLTDAFRAAKYRGVRYICC